MRKTLLILILTLFSLCGCAATDTTRYYLLTPEANPRPVEGAAQRNGIAIIVGQIRLPEYLNRSQIVTRLSDNELELGWFDRWAEPLERSFARTLAENIERLLNCRCTSALAPKLPPVITHRIEVDVVRMDGILGEKAVLDVWWSVYSPEKKLLVNRRSTVIKPAKGRGYEALVQAQSGALSDFSREVATVIAEEAKK